MSDFVGDFCSGCLDRPGLYLRHTLLQHLTQETLKLSLRFGRSKEFHMRYLCGTVLILVLVPLILALQILWWATFIGIILEAFNMEDNPRHLPWSLIFIEGLINKVYE